MAPVETAAAVERALVALLSATDPARGFEGLSCEGLAERPRRHLADLERLVQTLNGRLPPELASIRELLAADSGNALHTLRVLSGRAGTCTHALAASTRRQAEP